MNLIVSWSWSHISISIPYDMESDKLYKAYLMYILAE
jgi:hypothetical protein